MKFGGAMFFTEYSMTAPELAVALEERGYDSVWAPEHSHIPVSRKTPFPGGGDLPKQYADAMDPFVVLAAAANATKTIKLGTGVLLVQQRDTIQTAKLVASIDQVSGGKHAGDIGQRGATLRDHVAAVVDGGDVAVGIDREELGRLRVEHASWHRFLQSIVLHDRHMLEGDTQLVGEPDVARGTGAVDAIDGKHGATI